MRTINIITRVFLVSLLISGAAACSDPAKEEFTEAQAQQKLILAALESDLELSRFTEAFRAIDLSSSSATGFTILAVKNDALEGEIPVEVLNRHILETAYVPSAFTAAGNVTTRDGGELTVKTTEGVVALNNAPVGTHIVVGNSVIYKLDEIIPESNAFLGLAPAFDVTVSKVLRIRPEVIDLDGATFEWTMEVDGVTSIPCREADFNFITLAKGDYKLTLKATLPGGKELIVETTVAVTEPEEEYSPFPSRIIDLCPAPGQNLAALGNTKDEALNYMYNQLKGGRGNAYLGAFGAYVVVGFDHTIMNRPGFCDFTTKYGGMNISPSVIWVAYDANGNDMPDDDEWFEIKGSEHGGENDLGISSYTYQTTKTEATSTAVAGFPWTRVDGKTGAVTTGAVIDSHQRANDPTSSKIMTVLVVPWITSETYTLSGRELKPKIKPNDTFLTALPFDWGYAASQPNNNKKAAIDIDWAVDANGNSVHLPGVDFIKVVNAIQGMRPMMGEYRYQVTSIECLHTQTVEITTEEAQMPG